MRTLGKTGRCIVACVAALMLLVTTGTAWRVACVQRRALREAFQVQGAAFVMAYADAAELWLAQGDIGAIQRGASLLLLGSALYVQVVHDGLAAVADSRTGTPARDVPALEGDPDRFYAEYAVHSGGALVLDIVVPLETDLPGYVRVGLDAFAVDRGARVQALLVSGTAAMANVFLLGALYYGAVRRPRRRPGVTLPSAAGTASRSLQVDVQAKRVLLRGVEVTLTPKQFALLTLLYSAPGRVFSDKEILAAVWPGSRFANAKDVKQYVYLLRRRLGEVWPEAGRAIVNVPGFGYRLDLPVVDRALTGDR